MGMTHVRGFALLDFAIGEPRSAFSPSTTFSCLNNSMSASSTQTLAPATLATTDRCDRCGAQAYVLAELPGGSQLLFCGHHWGAHQAALRPKSINIIDELHRLNEAP
jgi:hypothetical protein